jgi:hypothetical protein
MGGKKARRKDAHKAKTAKKKTRVPASPKFRKVWPGLEGGG